jgi:hypothetical protein
MERTFTIYNFGDYSRNNTVFTKEALENAIKSVEDGTVYIYVNQNPNEEPGFLDIRGFIKEMKLDEESNSVIVKAEMLDTYKNYEKLFGHLVQAGAKNVSMSCSPSFEAQDDDVYLRYLNLKLDVPPSQRK